MVDYVTFSALRLESVFSPEFLAGFRWYSKVDADSGFDGEYQGGLWQDQQIDGVRFWFPEMDCSKLGIVDVWASPLIFPAAAKFENVDRAAGTFVPAWRANATRVLEALQFPVRFGDGEAVLRKLAAGPVWRGDFPDGTMFQLGFATQSPDVYDIQAIIHNADGLISFEIRRRDLVRANELDLGGGDDDIDDDD